MSNNSISSAETFATEMSFEVEDFSPPESPGGHDQSGPEPYRFEPQAQAAGAESADAEEEGQERMADVSEWYTMPPGGFECYVFKHMPPFFALYNTHIAWKAT